MGLVEKRDHSRHSRPGPPLGPPLVRTERCYLWGDSMRPGREIFGTSLLMFRGENGITRNHLNSEDWWHALDCNIYVYIYVYIYLHVYIYICNYMYILYIFMYIHTLLFYYATWWDITFLETSTIQETKPKWLIEAGGWWAWAKSAAGGFVPPGKLTWLDGKSPCLIGKSPCLIGKSPCLIGKSPFSIGNTSTQSGSILQPAMLDYRSVPSWKLI